MLEDGACLLLATAVKPAPGPAAVHPGQVRYQLAQSRQKQLREAFHKAAREQVPVTIHEQAMQEAVLPDRAAAAPGGPPGLGLDDPRTGK